ncbi:BQ2448_6568 [Microbotryum intermedium]|uniref:BQ2448_6568 protein n=1 Tax=Microbotryum intermedium TaxID=269621 RepID=A0A238FSP8_9BASI|nr:BQ2448_6568 [Microbotryum intermedium]
MTTVLPVNAAADVSRSPSKFFEPATLQIERPSPAYAPAAPVVSVSDLKEHEAKQKDFKKIEKVVKKEEKKDVKQLKVVEKDAKSKIKEEAKAAKELSKLQKKVDKAKLKEVKHKGVLTQAQAKYDASLTKLTMLTQQLDVKREDHTKLMALRDNKKATLEQVVAVKEENDATRKAVLDQAAPVLGQS